MALMSRLRTVLAPALLAGALAVTAAGCAGQSSSKSSADEYTGAKKDVAQVVDDLQSAAGKADGKKVCNDLLAPALVQKVATGGTTCKKAMEDLLKDVDTSDMTVKSVAVAGATATAVVESDGGSGGTDRTNTFTFAKDPGANGAWKISSFG